ncbi:hypothetical protein NQ315_012864, partial [Exocentrus adspersus]
MLAWYFLYFQEYYHNSMNREMFEKFGLFVLKEFIIEARRRATLKLELNGIGNSMEPSLPLEHILDLFEALLSEVVEKYPNTIIIIGGDFNCRISDLGSVPSDIIIDNTNLFESRLILDSVLNSR